MTGQITKMRRFATLLCVAAWSAELAYLASLQLHLGPIVVNGSDIAAGLRPAAQAWLIGAVIGLCLGGYALLTNRRWEWAVLISTGIFYVGWIATNSWGPGVFETYERKWMLAQYYGLLAGFFIRDVFMPGALLVASLLAIIYGLQRRRTRSVR